MAAPMWRVLGYNGLVDSRFQLKRWKQNCVYCLKLHTSSSYSVQEATAVSSTEHRAICRTNESNPVNHGTQHHGQYYTVPKSELPKFFPVGFTKRFTNQIKTFNEAAIMVRKPALEVIECLKAANYENQPVRYVLYGKRGAGKTLSLAHVIHYCQKEGWLVVHVPDAHGWNSTKRWDYNPSSYTEGLADKPVTGIEWLKHFKIRNEHFLKELTTTNTYTWSRREETVAGKPLMEVVDQGINRPKNSCDAIGVVLKELKLQSGTDKYRLVVAVRGVNGFYGDVTQTRREDKSIVHVREMSLVKHFQKLLTANWNNGAIVTTVDQQGAYQQPHESHLPKYLLRKEGFETMDPFIPVHVDEYSTKEFESCLEYYAERRWLQHPMAFTDEGKKELKFLTDHNPAELDKMCAGL